MQHFIYFIYFTLFIKKDSDRMKASETFDGLLNCVIKIEDIPCFRDTR